MGVNDAPFGTPDSYRVSEGQGLVVPADAGVLDNDRDIDSDSDALTAALVSGPSNGTLALNADGSFSYVPDAGFSGTDRFTYRASDGTDASPPTTVTLNVRPDDAPGIVNVTNGANGSSRGAVISGDGTAVAFSGTATNLTEDVAFNDDTSYVFLYDVLTGETVNVTQGANGASSSASLSADGTSLAFLSFASNLVDGEADTNRLSDVFVLNVVTGETVNVTRGSDGFGDVESRPSLSDDGTTVAFYSTASNLIDGDAEPNRPIRTSVFLYDVATGETIEVTEDADGFNNVPSLSADGAAGAFESSATNLVVGQPDLNGPTTDVFVFDLA